MFKLGVSKGRLTVLVIFRLYLVNLLVFHCKNCKVLEFVNRFSFF